jgi:hypothetical protein
MALPRRTDVDREAHRTGPRPTREQVGRWRFGHDMQASLRSFSFRARFRDQRRHTSLIAMPCISAVSQKDIRTDRRNRLLGKPQGIGCGYGSISKQYL